MTPRRRASVNKAEPENTILASFKRASKTLINKTLTKQKLELADQDSHNELD
jgi:hypothetical protein